MHCPHCQTLNRDDRATCYHCNEDLTMLRTVVNRAKTHFNNALEHAERERYEAAISELQHALELDAGFADAWMVLGTCYARLERFEEAKEAWNKALSQDPTSARCCEYLEKTDSVRRSLPAVRRMKAVMLAMAAVIVVLGIGYAALLRPDPAKEKVRKAMILQGEGNAAAALELLEDAANDKLAPGESRELAAFARDQLSARLEAELERVSAVAEAADAETALQAVAAMKKENLPGPILARLQTVENRIERRIVARFREAVARFEKDELAWADLKRHSEEALALLSGDETAGQVERLLADARKLHAERLLAKARSEIIEAASTADAGKSAGAWIAAYPEFEAEIRNLLKTRLDAATEKRVHEIDGLIEKGRLEAARKTVVEIRTLYESLDVPPPNERLSALERRIAKAEQSDLLERVRAAFKRGDDRTVAALTEKIEPEMLEENRLKELQTLRKNSLRRLADDFWEWSQARDQQFENLRLSREDALHAIKHYETALEHMPNPTDYKRSVILFRAAAAHLALDNAVEAKALIDRLKREYPNAAVLRYPAVKKLIEEKLEPALKKQAQSREPSPALPALDS